MMHSFEWVWNHPLEYVGIGVGVGLVVCFCMLLVGGNPGGMFAYGKWTVIGLLSWLVVWPLMLVAFVLLLMAAAVDD